MIFNEPPVKTPGMRKWLSGQNCLFPDLHEKAGFQEKIEKSGEEPYWICTYCTRVHLQFEVIELYQKNPVKWFVRGWQDGKNRVISGRESRFLPAEAPKLDREFLKNL
jgi:hypothetical protein